MEREISKSEQNAAGSLVKEGKRSYSHSRLDKVSRVKMNGRQEHFFWDNLAMISRNETEYGNEPDVTGGSPILADGDVLFNDLLGTTIGIRSGKEYRETGMTAFGETAEKAAMFTGKPYIGELGYAFLFRNCRPVSASGRPAIPSAPCPRCPAPPRAPPPFRAMTAAGACPTPTAGSASAASTCGR